MLRARKLLLFLLGGMLLITLNTLPVSGTDTIPWVRVDFSERLVPDESGYNRIFDITDRPDYTAFVRGITGMKYLRDAMQLKNDTILTIIDYTKPSSQKRIWVIDIKNQRLLHCALVAHGKNSGWIVPGTFSNTVHSNMSSQGFFITGETYYGKHGYSLRLDGVEEGINDNARKRAIVIHGASYATIDFVHQHGRLGRSFGCPALPPSKSSNIIDTIKEGTCLYIHANDQQYAVVSKILKPRARM